MIWKRKLPPVYGAKAQWTLDASGCREVVVQRLLLFLLSCLLCLLCLLRFLGHVALRDPKSWFNASRHSTCMHSQYTTIANLILRVLKKVNDAVATTAKALSFASMQTPVGVSRWVIDVLPLGSRGHGLVAQLVRQTARRGIR
jgi:hypothetical protein